MNLITVSVWHSNYELLRRGFDYFLFLSIFHIIRSCHCLGSVEALEGDLCFLTPTVGIFNRFEHDFLFSEGIHLLVDCHLRCAFCHLGSRDSASPLEQSRRVSS